MGKFVAEQTVKHLVRNGWQVKDAPVVVLGLTFKEDCPDLRNSRVIDVIRELKSYGADVVVHDPVAAPAEALHEYGVELVPWDRLPKAAAIVAAVAHREFKARPVSDYLGLLASKGVVADVKSLFDAEAMQGQGVTVWRL
jgi:UDP-N-acetyl-D-galactosamine dehydrogenase